MAKTVKEEIDPFKPITLDDLGGSKEPEGESLGDSDAPIEPDDVGMGGADIDLDDDDADPEGGIDFADDEIDPIGDAAMPAAGGTPDSDQLGNDPLAPPPAAPPAPLVPEKQVKWTSVPQDNGDIWSEHVDGFTLRARALSAKQGDKTKYTAQLFHDKKLLEKGVIWVPSSVDPQTVLQNVADRILDRMGLVSHSLEEPDPAPVPDQGKAVQDGDQPPHDPEGDKTKDETAADGGDQGGADLDLSDDDKAILGD